MVWSSHCGAVGLICQSERACVGIAAPSAIDVITVTRRSNAGIVIAASSDLGFVEPISGLAHCLPRKALAADETDHTVAENFWQKRIGCEVAHT
jgi:hypothetical protein